MKRLFFAFLLLAGFSTATVAQTTKAKVNSKTSSTTVSGNQRVTTKTHTISNPGISKTKTTVSSKPLPPNTVVLKKDGSLDKRYKVNKMKKKDGTPDMRYKENKKKD